MAQQNCQEEATKSEKAGTTCRERRSQWRTSRRTGRSSTDRIKRWLWSSERFLAYSLHLSSSQWTLSSNLCAERRDMSNSTEIHWCDVGDQVYITCCCEFLVRSGFLSSRVAHAQRLFVARTRCAFKPFGWRVGFSICVWVGNRSSAFVMMSSMIVHPVSWEWFE